MLKFLLPLCGLLCTVQSDCPPPLALPITNVSLSNGYGIRGIPVAIGTPPQAFSFIARGGSNDTWVYNGSTVTNRNNTPVCDNQAHPGKCITLRGGQYNIDASSSSSVSLGVTVGKDGFSDVTNMERFPVSPQDFVPASDKVKLGDVILSNYTFGMPDVDIELKYDTQNIFGVASGSSLLHSLKDAGDIASISYSWYYGRNSASSAETTDGQIVFGGRDTAKSTGPAVTGKLQKPSHDCPSGIYVDIKDMVVQFPNGTSTSMIQPFTLNACVHFENHLVITLPDSPYYDTFEALTGTKKLGKSESAVNYRAALYDAKEVFEGGILFDLGDGVQINITNDLLVFPQQTVSDQGAIISSSAISEILMSPDFIKQTVPKLGQQFFSAAYIFVDHESDTYTLWAANATSDHDLVAVGEGCADTRAGTDSTTSSKGKSMSAGDIAGAVIGSLVGVALIVTLAAMMVIRRKRRRQQKVVNSPAEQPRLDPNGSKQELAADDSRHELPARRPLIEMDDGRTSLLELETSPKALHEAPSGSMPSRRQVSSAELE